MNQPGDEDIGLDARCELMLEVTSETLRSDPDLRLCEGLPQLRTPRTYRVLERVFREAKERNGMRLIAYSVMGNHLHLIVRSRPEPRSIRLASRVRSARARTRACAARRPPAGSAGACLR